MVEESPTVLIPRALGSQVDRLWYVIAPPWNLRGGLRSCLPQKPLDAPRFRFRGLSVRGLVLLDGF